MPVVKAAAVQISPLLYNREGTVGKVVKKIIELGHQGVQFATFPETIVPYYPYFSFVEAPYQMGAEHYKLLQEKLLIKERMANAGRPAGDLTKHLERRVTSSPTRGIIGNRDDSRTSGRC